MIPSELERDYKSVAYALTSCTIGLIFMRLVVAFANIPNNTYGGYLANNALFSTITQLVFFLAIPFCIYKFYGKRTVKQTLDFSSIGTFKPYYLLALPLGISAFAVTIGISSAWTALLQLTGYTVPSAAPDMPDNFVFGFFVAELFITAVLPAVCEEFCMRGGTLTTAQNSFSTLGCVLLCGVIFGLFHQNIRQVFYTSLFGALVAFLTIRTKSLYPAMIAHFSNNFCSVFINYADNYNWFVNDGIYNLLGSMPGWATFLLFSSSGAATALFTMLMLFIREKKSIEKKKDVLKDCAFDATNKRVVLFGEYDPSRIEALDMEKEVYGSDYERPRYHPGLRDIAIPIALAVTTALTTIFTYVWGFFY